MKRFRLLALLCLLALLALLSVPRHGSTSTPALPAAESSTPPPARAAQLEPAPAAPALREQASHTPDSALSALLASGKVLDRRVIPAPGRADEWRTSQVVESSFKYPFIQIDETWQRQADGKERRIARSAHVADHAMMRFPAGFDREAVAAWCTRHGLTLRKKLATDDIFLVQAPRPVLDAVASLIRDFSTEFAGQELALAEPDYLQFAEATPSDPSFGSLWGLHNTGQSSGTADADIDAPEAWSLSTGSRDVVVGVIDTGIDRTHPDLAPNMWTNPAEIAGNAIDDDGNGFVDDIRGWDFYADDADPADVQGHGTHCAGTIGAVGDNLLGVAGVNWEVSLVSLRFLGDGGSGSTSDAVDAVNYARGLGITLTSNSWGGGGYSAVLEQAIKSAGNVGQLFIAAAGNDATNNDAIPHYPSSYPSENIIAVASTTRTDALSSFSCYGPLSVDLAAPGSDILSTTMGGTFGTKSGTSMATPHVAGAAALLYALSPDRSHIDIKNVLLQTADPLPVLNGICVSGGRLNLYRAAEYVAGPRVVPTIVDMTELQGNGDGIASPGEILALDVSFKNVGSEPADPSTASLGLAPPVPGAAISGGPYALGDLDPGQTTAPFRYTLTLDPLLATPKDLALTYTATTEGGQSWSETRTLPVRTLCHIRGRVLRLDGIGPIADATVSYSGPITSSVTSGPGGEFEILTIDGTHTLQASAPGYMPGTPSKVTVGPDAYGVELLLGVAEIQPSSTAFSLTLAAGDTAVRTVQIHNPGNVPIQWQATTRILAPAATPPPLAGLAFHPAVNPDRPDLPAVRDDPPAVSDPGQDLTGVGIGMLASTDSNFTQEMSKRGASFVNLSLPLGAGALEGLALIVIDDFIYSFSAADISLLREWAMKGGAILLGADNSGSMTKVNELLAGSGIQETSYNTFRDAVMTDILPHPVTADVSSVGATSYGSHCVLSGSAQALVRYASGEVFAAYSYLGSGRVVATGNEMNYSFDWPTGQTRLFVNQAVGWLAGRRWLQVADPATGSLAPGASATITLVIDAGFTEAGLHEGHLILRSNSPDQPPVEIPVQLTVTDAPAIAFEPPEIEFPDTALGGEATRELVVLNPGTLPLSISSLASNHAAFTIPPGGPVTLAPRERLTVPVTFHGEDLGHHEALITATSDDPTDPLRSATLRARAVTGAMLQHAPAAISVTLPQGSQLSEPLTLSNPGDRPLEWALEFTDTSLESASVSAADPLVTLLGRLDRGSSKVTSLIPSRFDFNDGVTNYYISDGGDDMYDSGNQLTTQPASYNYLDYSDGVIATDSLLLGTSRYFTRKYQGLFVCVMELGGFSTFMIDGGTGADGAGYVEASELVVQARGRTYRGFFKRVFGTDSPSINQLIIVEDAPGLSRTYATDTNDDDHTVSGLPSKGLLQYLLFAGANGKKVDDATALSIMRSYLEIADGALGWVHGTPLAGTLAPGASSTVALDFDARLMPRGRATGVLSILHNQAVRETVAVPLVMEVTPAPFLKVSAESLAFPDTATASTRRLQLTLTNTGSGPLTASPSIGTGAPAFTLPHAGSTPLAAGESHTLAVDFMPGNTGAHGGSLTIATGLAGQAALVVSLAGNGIEPGPLTVSPQSLAFSLASGSSSNQALTLSNSSASAVTWTAVPGLTGGPSQGGPLQGVRVLVIDSSAGYSDDLRSRLQSAGATASFVYYYNFDPANLAEIDLVFIDGSLENLSAALTTALRNWVSAGGALILGHDYYYLSYANVLAAGSGITFSMSATSATTTSLLPHPATYGVTSLPSAYFESKLTVTAPAIPIATTGSITVGAAVQLGSGRMIFLTDNMWEDRTGTETRHLDFALQASRWATKRSVDWLRVSSYSGTTAAGGNSPLTVTVDATGIPAGIHHADLVFSSGTPAQTLTVPVQLQVSGVPELAVTPAVINVPPTFANSFQETEFTIENRGAAPLVISSIDCSHAELSIRGTPPLTVAPFGKSSLFLRHQPLTPAGPLSANLTLHSNDPARLQHLVPVTTSALTAPVASLAGSLPLQFTLASGSNASTQVTLANTGGSDLAWSTIPPSGSTSSDVGSLIAKLDADQTKLLAAIPHHENFEEGVSGSMITDGGNNLFDGGNQISTNLAPHASLAYSDGTVVWNSGTFGSSGRYFTRKYPSLFVLAADMTGVGEFRINGNLGANGAGSADAISVLLPYRQTIYRGFLKRVHGAGMRTLNQLVIVEDKPGLAQNFATNTNDQAHTISGLGTSSRLYYLLFAGSTDTVIDDAGAKGIMAAFLDVALGTQSFRSANPTSGTVPTASATTVTINASAIGLNGGFYRSELPIFTNDPLRPVLLVPVELTVIGTPSISLSRTTATFPSLFTGAQATPISMTVTNNGTEVLAVSSLAADPPFSVDVTQPFTLAPGAQKTLNLGFNSPATGTFQGKLRISSNAANLPSAEVSLSGTATPAPQAAADASSFTVNLSGSSSASRSLTLSNPGGAALQWTSTAAYAEYQAADGKDLAGLRVGIFSSEPILLMDLEDHLLDRGASLTYLSHNLSPDPSPYDVLLVDNVVELMSAAYVNTLRTWVQNGGCMLNYSTSTSFVRANALLTGSGLTVTTFSSSYNPYSHIFADHPISTGLTRLDQGVGYPRYTQFNVVAPAVALVKGTVTSGTAPNVIALAPQGKGWIMASTMGFYDLFAFHWWDNEIFSRRAFSWLGGRLRTWITPTPASGTIAISGSTPVNYAINAAGMKPGTYQATIKVATNSPAQPLISIPVTLQVPVESRLLANKPSIAFAETKVGLTTSTSLRLDHRGTVPVVISAIELPPGFSTTNLTLPVTLRSESSVTFNVRFNPVTAGDHSGNLKIISDAITTPALIPLSGNARLGAVLDYSAPPLEWTRFANATGALPVQITNGGVENLTWSASVRNPSQPGSGTPVLGALRVGLFANNHGRFSDDMALWGATLTKIPTNAGLLSPGAYDTIVIDGRMTSLVSAHFTALRDWVKAGGTLILEGGTYSSVSRLNSLIKDSGLSAIHIPVQTAEVVNFTPHPLTQNLPSLNATDCEIGFTASGTSQILARLPDGTGVVGLGKLGAGTILAMGQQFFADSRYGRMLVANAMGVLQPGSAATWLSVNGAGGTLVPGAGSSLQVAVNPAGLPPGTYRRQIQIESNDPLRAKVLLTASLTVIAPWTIEPGSVDFGGVVSGDLATRLLVISGTNAEPLALTPSLPAGSPFAVHAPVLPAVAAGAPLKLPLSFQPPATGAATGTLVLETLAGSLEVPLSGSGVTAGDFPLADFAQWRNQHFPAGGLFTGMSDDPDGDGLDLATEYAFLRDPHLADGANPLVIAGLTPGELRLRYTRRASFPDSAFPLEASSDLGIWAPFSPAQRTLTVNPDGSTSVEFDVPRQGARKLFLRGSVGGRRKAE